MQTTLAVGATVVVERRFDAQKMCETLIREKATMFFGVPTMYVGFSSDDKGGALPQLRLWVAGSAALSAETWNAFKEKFGDEILERYGATETCMCITNRFRGPRTAGARWGCRTRASARGSSIPATLSRGRADGEVGELLINGPNVFSGYYKNPQAPKDAFVVDADGARWFRSGDLSSLRSHDSQLRDRGPPERAHHHRRLQRLPARDRGRDRAASRGSRSVR